MEFILDKIIIEGGNTRLEGEVIIEGAKNAVLPLLAATILPKEGKTVLTNVPILSDVFTMNNVVRGLDIQVDFDEAKNTSRIRVTIHEGKFHQVKRMFEAVGSKVLYLKRLSMGTLVLDESLAPGAYRRLTEQEIQMLKETRNIKKNG